MLTEIAICITNNTGSYGKDGSFFVLFLKYFIPIFIRSGNDLVSLLIFLCRDDLFKKAQGARLHRFESQRDEIYIHVYFVDSNPQQIVSKTDIYKHNAQNSNEKL